MFIGLKYGQEANTGIYFNKLSYDTIATYVNPNGGDTYNETAKSENYYNFGINSDKLILPLGINFCTNKEKYVWITTGIEFAPVVNFNYRVISSYGNTNSIFFVKQGDGLDDRDYFSNTHTSSSNSGSVERSKLNGIGYGFSASLPFSIYLHPFKKAKFFKRLNAMACIRPTFVLSHGKYFGSATEFGVTVATGLRYNL